MIGLEVSVDGCQKCWIAYGWSRVITRSCGSNTCSAQLHARALLLTNGPQERSSRAYPVDAQDGHGATICGVCRPHLGLPVGRLGVNRIGTDHPMLALARGKDEAAFRNGWTYVKDLSICFYKKGFRFTP